MAARAFTPITDEEFAAMPIFVGLEDARRVLGISRTTAYELARRDELPVPVIRIGRSFRISREALRALARDGVPARP